MRSTRRAAALLTALVAALLLTGPAPAATADPVGGAALTGTGVTTRAAAAPPPVSAASYVVADLDTGAVLAAKDPHGQYAPASTLKTLTALTLIPRLDPARQVTPTQADADVDGSKVGLVPSMSYSVHDLFAALLVVSANDAAMTLADAAGGTDATAQLMDAQARQLGAGDTHAVNPSGLDAPGQVSSAYDLALVARAAMALPDFRAYVATRRSTIPAPGGTTIEIDTHDRLLGSYPGAIGIKNGFTEAARASFVGAATRDGHTVLITLMRSEPAFWKDAAALLDWGFAALPGAEPVGRLVSPAAAKAPPSPTAPAPTAAGTARAALRPAAAAQGGSGEGRTALLAVVVLLVLLTALRRRAVVRARARRRGGRVAGGAGIGVRQATRR